jgi:hypothetical protein
LYPTRHTLTVQQPIPKSAQHHRPRRHRQQDHGLIPALRISEDRQVYDERVAAVGKHHKEDRQQLLDTQRDGDQPQVAQVARRREVRHAAQRKGYTQNHRDRGKVSDGRDLLREPGAGVETEQDEEVVQARGDEPRAGDGDHGEDVDLRIHRAP